MTDFVMVLALLVVFGVLFFFLKLLIQKEKELREIKNKIEAEENERKKKDEAKESLHTGDSVTDFNNSIDVLSHLKK